ncbi:MAG: TonB-dependent receptor plug domain-containing protein [Candidatus Omnitrophota bacterium]
MGWKGGLTVLLFLFLGVSVSGIENSAEVLKEEALKKLLDVKINAASKYAQSVEEAPASVSIITSEEIRQFGYRTLDDILMRVRGFYLTNDLHYGYIGVRGISRPSDYNNRVLILINGLSIFENVFGSSLIGYGLGLDVETIDRVEIVRGPASALYGSNAMLAIINVITRNGKSEDGVHLSFQKGNFGKFQAAIRGGNELNNGLDFFMAAHTGMTRGQDYYFKEFDDPSTNHGIAKAMDDEQYNGLFSSLTYRGLSVQTLLASRDKRVPTASYGTAFNDPRLKTKDSQYFLELAVTHRVSYNQRLNLRGYYNTYDYNGAYPYDAPDYTTLQRDRSLAEWYGFEGQLCWDLRPGNRLIVGVEHKNNFRSFYTYRDDFGVPFAENHPFRIWAFYLQDDIQALRNLSLTLGVRYDAYSDRGSNLSPRIALIYHPFSRTTLKFLYGKAFRAPNFNEIYCEVDGEAKKNLSIKGENLQTVEMEMGYRFSPETTFALSLYSFHISGLIDPIVDPEDGLVQFQNHGSMKSRGIEVEFHTIRKNQTSGYVSYGFQQSVYTDTAQTLSNSPAHLFKSGLSARLLPHFSAAAELFYESGRMTVYDTMTKPHALVNLHLLISNVARRLEFALSVKNLFNTRYQAPGSVEHVQPTLPQPGRAIIFKIGYRPFG